MPTPTNNLFSNAASLGGSQTGLVNGTNISASFEPLNPSPYHSSSVWYKWSPTGYVWDQTNGNVYFSTAETSPTEPALRTEMHIYIPTGSTVDTCIEVPYINTPAWSASAYHWDYGSVLAMNFTNSVTYFIRVDSVYAGAPQGNFNLYWGIYYNRYLAPKDACPPDADNFPCLAMAQVSQSKISPQSFTFGTWPSGSYIVKYCQGAYHSGLYTQTNWNVVYKESFNPFAYLQLSFFYTGSPTTQSFDNIPSPSTFWSQAEAENKGRCISKQWLHSGGPIKLHYRDDLSSDNDDGVNGTNPVFGLYRVLPNLALASACAHWNSTALRDGNVVMTIQNLNGLSWDAVTASLSGVNLSSITPVTITGSLPSSSNTSYTFNFSCSQISASATIALSSPYWDSPVSFSSFLAPALVATVGVSAGAPCRGTNNSDARLTIHTFGNWGLDGITGSVTISNGLQFMNPFAGIPSCGVIGSTVGFALQNIECNPVQAFGQDFLIKSPTVTTLATMSVTIANGLYGTYNFPVTISP